MASPVLIYSPHLLDVKRRNQCIVIRVLVYAASRGRVADLIGKCIEFRHVAKEDVINYAGGIGFPEGSRLISGVLFSRLLCQIRISVGVLDRVDHTALQAAVEVAGQDGRIIGKLIYEVHQDIHLLDTDAAAVSVVQMGVDVDVNRSRSVTRTILVFVPKGKDALPKKQSI